MVLWVRQIKDWFSDQKELAESKISLQELPWQTQEKLQIALSELPSPQIIIEAIQNGIESAIDRWLNSPSAPNYFIILGNPVEPISQFIQDSINKSQIPPNIPLNCLSLPPAVNPEQRQQQLAQKLQEVSLNSRLGKQLLLIPNLSNCFLRCIGGLDAMNFLGETVLEDKQKFWIVGCHTWAWEYLDRTNQIQANFEQTFCLPTLNGNDLKIWLKPASSHLYMEEDEDEEQAYFEKLSKTALGLSEVAKELWFFSLGCEQQNDEDITSSLPIKRRWEKLPKLPKITIEDRYLLYSVLLHQQLSFDCLVITLGDVKSLVKSQVKKLKNLGLIQEKSGLLRINQLYYPQLLVDLEQNNFSIYPRCLD